MTRFLRISHIFMAECQVLFENANIAILSPLLDPAASLNSIVSNFIILHTCIYVHWIFREEAFLLDVGVVWKRDKLKALLNLAALERAKSETTQKRSCVDSWEKLKCNIFDWATSNRLDRVRGSGMETVQLSYSGILQTSWTSIGFPKKALLKGGSRWLTWSYLCINHFHLNY